jgi:hypothetical protein
MTPQLAPRDAVRGAYDPLDRQLDQLGARDGLVDALPAAGRPARRAWSSSVQAVVLLLVGVALGPHGLGILRDTSLSLVDPVVPVALAAVGVLVAFEIGATRWIRSWVLAAAAVQGVIAALVVTGGTLALTPIVMESIGNPWILAAALGVCASTSSVLPNSTRSSVVRLVDVDAVLPIIAGGLMIAAIREQGVVPALLSTAQVLGIALTVATAGWLLLMRTRSETEQRVFSVATLLLLGGVADYLAVSALMAGLVAGAFWHLAGGSARESIRRDLAHVQHPLLALILVVAGARTEFSQGIVGLTVAYVLLRAVGKLAGSIVTARAEPATSRDVTSRLLSPGILGVAFALTVVRAIGPDAVVVLSVAVLGTIGSQLLAGTGPPEEPA